MTHHHVADIGAAFSTAEVDHQAGPQNDHGECTVQAHGLEAAGVAHDDTDNHRPKARARVVDLAHVAGHCNGELVVDHTEVEEVVVPAVEAEEQGRGERASTKNRRVFEQLISNEAGVGIELLPDRKDEKEDKSNDQHADKSRRLVFGSAKALEAKWEEDKDKGGDEQDCTDHY